VIRVRGMLLTVAIGLIALLALAQGENGAAPLVVPGTELGWETAKLELVLRVSEEARVHLEVYSPGFDPDDYRSPNEFGDERYDGADTPLRTLIRVFDGDGELRLRREYGVEPHRWHTLIDGELAPGDYLVEMQFFGNGKNALAFRLNTEPAGRATLEVAPGSMQTYNVHGEAWQYPFTLEQREGFAPITVGIYDGDGPGELLVRVQKPDGSSEALPTPGNGEWVRYRLDEDGRYRFGFSQPPTARQYTNTVGFKVFQGEVKVGAVDTEGRPVEGVAYTITGHYDRIVFLQGLPEGWELVDTRIRYGVALSPSRTLFGPGGGEVVYVLRRAQGTLTVRAAAVCGETRQPVPLRLRLGDETVTLPKSGQTTLTLPPGTYPVTFEAPGARAEAPETVTVAPGSTGALEVKLYPEVALELKLQPAELVAGEATLAQARLTTRFPYTLPATLRLKVPEGLAVSGNPAVTSPLSASHPVRLSTWVRAEEAGEHELVAVASPCAAEARAELKVARPAQVTLRKAALTEAVAPGETARFRITVENRGGAPARVRVVDDFPAGLEGEGLDRSLVLEPGETQTFEVAGTVAATAPETLVNTARIYLEGQPAGESRAEVAVTRPRLTLERTIDKRMAVPGETVRVCLRVANEGASPVTYRLTDRYPEWLEPLSEPEFSGTVAPGEKAEHCYEGRVRFGPEAEGRFEARLVPEGGGTLQAAGGLKRTPLVLQKVAQPRRVVEGEVARFEVTLTNPTDHEVPVRLLEAPAEGLGMKPATETLTLGPGASRTFTYEARPEKVGSLENRVSVFVGDTPAAPPARATLEVLPRLQARRVSEIKLPFTVEGAGDALLIAHRLPEGARYLPGSSRLDGRPIDEPRQSEDGRLIWKLPFAREGVLTYTVEHASALPQLPAPELTLLAGGRELFLAGQLTLEDYEAARPLRKEDREGLIQYPLPGTVFRNVDSTRILVVAPYGAEVRLTVNGRPVDRDRLGEAEYNAATGTQRLAYYGVPLEVGRNVIEVETAGRSDRVEVFRAGRPVTLVALPEEVVADGRTPIRLRIEARDDQGFATGMGFVTVESSVEPMLADANLHESGYQVLLKDGVGELVLRPLATPGEVVVRMAKDRIEGESKIYVPGSTHALWTAQGSVTVRYGGDALEVGGQVRGYLERPLAGGTLQGAVSVGATTSAGSVSYFPDLRDRDPNRDRFPLVGSGNGAERPLESDDGVALKYDSPNFSVGYYRTSLALPGLKGMPTATALVVRSRGQLEAGGFVALLPSTEIVDEIVPDGTRTYRLSRAVRPGSETVYLRTGALETRLTPLRDYVIDYPTGHITLARPLWPTATDNVTPVRLIVSYAPENAPRDTPAFGAGARYRMGPFTFGLAAASLDRGATWKFGAEAAYATPTLRLTLGYAYEDGRGVVGLSAAGHQGPVEASGNLRYDGTLQGKLRLAAEVGAGGKVALEHRGSGTSNRSTLLYEHRFGRIDAGVGASYEWTTATLGAVGRLGYSGERLRVSLTHTQGFSTAPVLTTLNASYTFDANLKLDSELAYTWGEGLSGTLGLNQRLGPANLSLSYALPNSDGGGNRARFGIAAPLPLSETTTLDLSAGYDRDLASGAYQAAAGAGVRYKTDDLTATLGVEGTTGSEGSKVTLRTGATGRLDERQTLSFDANYVFAAEPHGRFTLAYAYRGSAWQVLTYHRMTSEGGLTFEGELAPTWHPTTGFQLRPSAAYRVALPAPETTLYQVGLGANYYPLPRLGIGGGVYYLWQPALAQSATAFSVEASVRLIDPVWVNLGYTFGGFTGLTPEARPGWYLRMDFLGEGGI